MASLLCAVFVCHYRLAARGTAAGGDSHPDGGVAHVAERLHGLFTVHRRGGEAGPSVYGKWNTLYISRGATAWQLVTPVRPADAPGVRPYNADGNHASELYARQACRREAEKGRK